MRMALVLRAPAPGRLVFTLPVWYRPVMGAILAVLAAALATAGGRPGILGISLLGGVGLAALYEERWTLDARRGRIVQREGLVLAARCRTIPFGTIERLRLVPHVQGSLPGGREGTAPGPGRSGNGPAPPAPETVPDPGPGMPGGRAVPGGAGSRRPGGPVVPGGGAHGRTVRETSGCARRLSLMGIRHPL